MFCTATCGKAYRVHLNRRKLEQPCQQCSRPLTGTRRYCSKDCRLAGRDRLRRETHKTCYQCRLRFEGPGEGIFCSIECRQQSQEARQLAEIELRLARKKVRDSRAQRRSESIPAITRLKRLRLAQDKMCCEVCEWVPPPVLSKKYAARLVHAHHVVPLASGGGNDPDNILFLCPNHHALAHRLGSQRHGIWYGAVGRKELLNELLAAECDPDLWRRIIARRIAEFRAWTDPSYRT